MTQINWKPIETAPSNKVVLLLSHSGYRAPHDKRIGLGYKNPDFRGDDWLTMSHDRWTDSSSSPQYWAEAPQEYPDVKL